MRLPTGRLQKPVPLTKYAPKRARGTGRDKEETHSLKRHGGSTFRSHTSQTIQNSLCAGDIVPPGYKGRSQKEKRNSPGTRLLQICWNSHGEGNSVTRIADVSTLKQHEDLNSVSGSKYQIRSKVNWWDREEQ